MKNFTNQITNWLFKNRTRIRSINSKRISYTRVSRLIVSKPGYDLAFDCLHKIGASIEMFAMNIFTEISAAPNPEIEGRRQQNEHMHKT